MNVSPCEHGVGINNDGAEGGIGGANRAVRIKDIKDGTSTTVAVNELRAGLNPNDLRGSWAMPGLGSGPAAMFNDASAPNSREPFADDMENCAVAGLFGVPPMGCFDNTGTSQMTSRSMHYGGMHALMTDGAVRFISDSIDFSRNPTDCGTVQGRGLWQALHTRGGSEVVDEF
jgi:hypothetical protein